MIVSSKHMVKSLPSYLGIMNTSHVVLKGVCEVIKLYQNTFVIQ